jgi:hypothetical protein
MASARARVFIEGDIQDHRFPVVRQVLKAWDQCLGDRLCRVQVVLEKVIDLFRTKPHVAQVPADADGRNAEGVVVELGLAALVHLELRRGDVAVAHQRTLN